MREEFGDNFCEIYPLTVDVIRKYNEIDLQFHRLFYYVIDRSVFSVSSSHKIVKKKMGGVGVT